MALKGVDPLAAGRTQTGQAGHFKAKRLPHTQGRFNNETLGQVPRMIAALCLPVLLKEFHVLF